MHYSNLFANPISTIQTEPNHSGDSHLVPSHPQPKGPNQAIRDQNSVNWSGLQGAVAISAARAQQGTPAQQESPPKKTAEGKAPPPAPKLARFLSSGVMISPTIGLTAAHALENTVDVYIMDSAAVEDTSKHTSIKSYKIHPEYVGNNFNGIDLAIFELAKPMKLDKYFVPTALSNQALQNAVLQRVGFGERDTGDGEENRRTWILENYNRHITGENYLTSEDKYGYPGDSGGPVFRTIGTTATQIVLELVGIHVGRMLSKNGEPVNESNTLIFNADILAWIKKTSASFQEGSATTATTTPSKTSN